MTKANSNWEFRGTDLSTVAWNVRALGAPEQVPTRRGENLVIPGKTGRQSMSSKKLDERRLQLSMFVKATPQGGGDMSGSQLWANLDTLKKLFATDGVGTLKHESGAGTTRIALAEVVDTVEFQPEGPWHYVFVVEFAMADPFWYAEAGRTFGPTTITGSPQNMAIANNGTYQSAKGILRVTGQIVDPKVEIDDYWVQYTGTVSSGSTLTIDVGNYQALLGTVDVSGDISHSGGLEWLIVPTGGSITMTVTGSSLSSPSVRLDFTEPYI